MTSFEKPVNEAAYENSVIQLFETMSYKHVYGPDFEQDFYSPLYDDVLATALDWLNPSLPSAAQKEGSDLGLTPDEVAFYDALTRPEAVKDFYENDELIAITKELTDTLRKNKTIDWQKRENARAKMRLLIKKLLKKHKYPPEGMEDAVSIVMTQCELWADNIMEA